MLSLLIVIVAALAATGLAALGLRLFFRLLESNSSSEPAIGAEKPASRD